MRDESDIEKLQREVEKAEALIRQTIAKVERIEASIDDSDRFKDRLVIFPRHKDGKLPVRMDKSKNIEDIAST